MDDQEVQRLQREHEKLFVSLRSDIDHITQLVVPEIRLIRQEVTNISAELNQVTSIRAALESLGVQLAEIGKKLESANEQLVEGRIDRAKIREVLSAHIKDFEKHREYESNWRREHEVMNRAEIKKMEDASTEWEAKHELSHLEDKKDWATKTRTWEARIWDILKPLLIGAIGMLLARTAYDTVNPAQTIRTDAELVQLVQQAVRSELGRNERLPLPGQR